MDVVEHRFTAEHRLRSKRQAFGDRLTWTQTRYVCVCGRATKWWGDARQAEVERDAHAMPGQLSMIV